MKKLYLCLLTCSIMAGQSIEPLTASFSEVARVKSGARNVTVFTGDNVIPQFVDGGGWDTAIKVINLETTRTIQFDIYFVSDSGQDMVVDVVGVGASHGVKVTLPINQSMTIRTAGTAPNLRQGWALIDRDDDVGGLAIFRQSIPGRQSQEATVPITGQFESKTTIFFDNVGTATGAAVVNPYGSTTIFALVRDEAGAILGTHALSLPTNGHTAFDIGSQWPETQGKRGVIEFTTSRLGVAVLGLRFNGSAFTSMHSIEALAF